MRAVLGGSGFYRLTGMKTTRRQVARTPYGVPSGALTFGRIDDCAELVFLARHGYGHTLAPHLINYRANLWALRQVGVTEIIAVSTVGGIRADLAPGSIVLPDQIIDYTWGRVNTFVDETTQPVVHVDMTTPYSPRLREELRVSARECDLELIDGGTYGCTQGPRLETAAEIRRLERDGCDVVGMTGMPEAALARELGMEYAAICVVSNYAAGVGPSATAIAYDDARTVYEEAMQTVQRVLASWCRRIPEPSASNCGTAVRGLEMSTDAD